MGSKRISDRDSLFRQTIHPITFRGKAFAPEKFLKLYDRDDGSLLASLTWERYVPTAKLVHDYGCRLASRMNERLPGKSKDRRKYIYCGAYQTKGGAIRALPDADGLDDVLSADVVHHIEYGELAHTDLRIVLKSNPSFNVEGTKTAILDRLWTGCCGPLRHKCECDADVIDHPSTGLDTPPGGIYFDTRSFLSRVLCVLRFHVYSWIWRHFYRPRNSSTQTST